MLIKICGMRQAENIAQISENKIDMMGFIFYEKSKRFVEQIPVEIANHIKKVGVFVNETFEDIVRIMFDNKLDAIQLHGDESPELCADLRKIGQTVLKAFRVNDDFDFALCSDYEETCNYFLFDTAGKNFGGNGTKFNWEILQSYTGNTPFLLSGGIKPTDFETIINFKHPKFSGVDINSGFEIEPGLKNVSEVKEFVEKLRKTSH